MHYASGKDYVDLKVSDGTTMAAYVTRPTDRGKHPGIMVFQEAFGVNSYIRDVADRFAKEGFTAIAPELFHRTGPGFEGNYSDFPGVQPHTSKLTVEGLEADARAAYDWFKNDHRPAYNEKASKQAWPMTLEFLKYHLK
ncbi:MAG: dienelactone hydrolase family protein [Bacteroidetes bacterium]|nr:dienelactone hydrolase family protein [Bacteroidota bacterium]